MLKGTVIGALSFPVEAAGRQFMIPEMVCQAVATVSFSRTWFVSAVAAL